MCYFLVSHLTFNGKFAAEKYTLLTAWNVPFINLGHSLFYLSTSRSFNRSRMWRTSSTEHNFYDSGLVTWCYPCNLHLLLFSIFACIQCLKHWKFFRWKQRVVLVIMATVFFIRNCRSFVLLKCIPFSSSLFINFIFSKI